MHLRYTGELCHIKTECDSFVYFCCNKRSKYYIVRKYLKLSQR